jgi:hypothetical protein
MDKATMATLVERIEALEREKRQLVWVGVAFVASALLLLVGTVAMMRRPKVLEAERFVLKDKGGQVRALLSLAPDGSPSLALLDAKGRDHLRLHGTIDGTSALELYSRGDLGLYMSSSSGGSMMSLSDRKHRAGVGMYLWPDSTAGLALNSGEQGVHLAAQPDGLAGIMVADENGKERGRVGALPAGVQCQSFLNADGKPPFRDRAAGPARVAMAPPRRADGRTMVPTLGTLDVSRPLQGRLPTRGTARTGPQPL